MPSPAAAASSSSSNLHHLQHPTRGPPAPPPTSSPPPPPPKPQAPPPPISKTPTSHADSPEKNNYYYAKHNTTNISVAPSPGPDSSVSPIPIPSSAFSVASLPRTSSLLPPPHPETSPRSPSTAGNTTATTTGGGYSGFHHTYNYSGSAGSGSSSVIFPVVRKPNANSISIPTASPVAGESEREPDLFFLNASNASPFFTPSVRDPDVPRIRRPSASHSRASSIGGHSEGFRNLNRWSASTASSFASNANPLANSGNPTSHRSSHARRMSVDAANLIHHPFGGLHSSSPRNKLQKSRPSTAGGSPDRPTLSKARPPSTISPPSLAPIITLPSLESSVQGKSAILASSIAASSAGSDIRGNLWDDKLELPSKLITGPGSQLLPAATITSAGGGSSSGGGNSGKMLDQNGDARARGHTRQRSTNKASSDSTSSKSKGRQQPSQKAMLSKALQRANLAVQLDNAQNFDGARESYAEACELLQQVLQRTSGEDDKKKLEAIRQTYTSRIAELDQMLPADDKALPARPDSDEFQEPEPASPVDDSFDVPVIETATVTRIIRDESSPQPPPSNAGSRKNSGLQMDPSLGDGSLTEHYSLQSSFSKSPVKDRNINHLVIQQPDPKFLPAPLSPIRPLSPAKPAPSPEPPVRSDFSIPTSRLALDSSAARGHMRTTSHESISWLDPIDESGGSAVSSVHSRSSSMGVRRKPIRRTSGDTEAEFDAALDAAVEAAYDDGYEPMDNIDRVDLQFDDDDEVISNALRKVELARERVRQSEREAAEMSQEREKRFNDIPDGVFYDGNDSEDEERILEEVTRGGAAKAGMVGEDFSFDRPRQQNLPRESDSSINTSRTWHTSVGSNAPTSLSTVTEISPTSTFNKSLPPPPPPTTGLPAIPQGAALNEQSSLTSLQTRRLSGQNPKQLKIETQRLLGEPPGQAQSAMASMSYAAAPWPANQASGPRRAAHIQKPSITKTPALSVPTDMPPPTPPLAQEEGFPPSRTGSPSVSRPGLRKNFSSSSLRSLKQRNLSVSHIDDASEVSPITPNNQFGGSRVPAMPTIPTPLSAAFRTGTNSSMVGGPQLFETINSPEDPGSPNPLMPDAPVPLEPCPNDHMLRPFWLMRCLYQTLCHPRGGYVTNKLFVPRDVWRVKGTKLKNIDEKISQCDYLTAALEKLGEVDTCDADAVLEEMQSIEGLLEQVQTALSRKLGHEVGVQSTALLFKEASDAASDSAASVPRSASVSGKSASFSWRRLRSKNSGMSLNNPVYGPKPTPVDGPKDAATLQSLPMTSHPTSRPTKRDVGAVKFTGPNANYMASLARLFDAAQTLDQIARQVEDPGLRHADKTQVGLELCTRHAAEFFGFFICRFVLADLSLLMDKFIKRGTEWEQHWRAAASGLRTYHDLHVGSTSRATLDAAGNLRMKAATISQEAYDPTCCRSSHMLDSAVSGIDLGTGHSERGGPISEHSSYGGGAALRLATTDFPSSFDGNATRGRHVPDTDSIHDGKQHPNHCFNGVEVVTREDTGRYDLR
ncbi:hypothetical protein MKZ38_002666 [Zalerion maritima]|uniref:MIT domain-containing protein n=1 Tax=Zalerion maritima TaxID=339359 RepID=A0AAD5RVE7_9PEZI|nr:hypothetical protein MKZ38_002666 [Zalerion maritima]